ncbi:DMT family transporter [Microtetraspora malaysiensis]|uniref:DMT family transporter n=1 Tax=Microtetraspora malaysiensis TaxID=161358 RepID=UPI003D8CC3A5
MASVAASRAGAADRWARRSAWLGTVLALVGVVSFSGSFPGTVFGMRGFDPYLLTFARAGLATLAAVACLAMAGAPLLPPRQHLRSYLVIAVGVVFGFPLFSALALHSGASTAHAAVVTGLLPAATAVGAVLRAGERPRPLFWMACAGGALSITVFVLTRGGGRFAVADLLLVLALVGAAAGYTEGGRLARETPGWRVISYSLVVAAPVTVPVTIMLAFTTDPSPDVVSLGGLAYVGLVSMFLGFIPWYAGLAMGGIARAGQVQLAQPLLTLLWAWLLMGERFGWATVAAALVVLACVAVTQVSRGLGARRPDRT